MDRCDFYNMLRSNEFSALLTRYNVCSDPRIQGYVKTKPYFTGFHEYNVQLISSKIGKVNFNKVLGPANPKAPKLELFNWASGLECGLHRSKYNLQMLRRAPEYYWRNEYKVAMDFASFDGGETYYIKAGNHRAYIAKLLFILEEYVLGASEHELSGVEIFHYEVLDEVGTNIGLD